MPTISPKRLKGSLEGRRGRTHEGRGFDRGGQQGQRGQAGAKGQARQMRGMK